jgi:homoserine dehydrogenase
METKKELSIKSVLGILVGTFSFLFTSIANGMNTYNAIIISAVIAGAGFLFAWFGLQQISIVQLGKMLTDVLTILSDKTKDAQAKMLEIELTIKKELEILNLSWNALNSDGQSALKTVTEVVCAATNLPGQLGAVAKVAATALESLKPAEVVPIVVPPK